MSEQVGRYQLVALLTSSESGKVHLARSPGHGEFARHVVVKTFDDITVLDDIDRIGLLHHHHIAPILDVGRDGKRAYVVMDYIHGRSARDVWQQTFTLGALLPLDFALTIVAAAASGLHYAHTRPMPIVHGSAAPANLLIGFDGSVQWIGFATTAEPFAKRRVAYLSPEQARNQHMDVQTDVFALGILLYELTTMRPAFRDASDRLTIERIKSGAYAKPRSFDETYPVELERIVTRALHIDPSQRYPDAEALRREIDVVGHALELVLGDAAVVEVMTQLFDDRSEPWASERSAPALEVIIGVDHLDAETDPPARRTLRAATETYDALSIELDFPVDPDPPTIVRADSSRDTQQTEALTRDTDATPALPAAALENETIVGVPALAPRRPARADDTEGVPVAGVPLPRKPAHTKAEPKLRPAPPARTINRRVMWIAAAAGMLVLCAIVYVVIGGGGAPTKRSTDAALALPIVDAMLVAEAIDAGIVDAAVATIAIDAVPMIDAPKTTIDAARAATVIDAAPGAMIAVRVTSTPPDATIELDRQRLGKTPFDGTVEKRDGIHILKVRMKGYATQRIEVELTGDLVRDVVLVRATAPIVDAGAPPGEEQPPPPPKSDLDVPD